MKKIFLTVGLFLLLGGVSSCTQSIDSRLKKEMIALGFEEQAKKFDSIPPDEIIYFIQNIYGYKLHDTNDSLKALAVKEKTKAIDDKIKKFIDSYVKEDTDEDADRKFERQLKKLQNEREEIVESAIEKYDDITYKISDEVDKLKKDYLEKHSK
jgi:hypothetical protein